MVFRGMRAHRLLASRWSTRPAAALLSRLGLTLACMHVFLPLSARAHDLPKGRALLWRGTGPDELPIVLTNRGLLFPELASSDLHYSLRCNEAYGASVSELTHARIVSDERLLVVSSSSAQLSADRGCTFEAAQGIPAVTLGGFTQPAKADDPLLLSTVDPEGESQLLVSVDQGESFTTRSTNAPGELYTALLVAPSDVARVFASGARVNREENTLERLWARSVNGGTSFEHTVVTRELRPLGVHPTDPQVMFAYEPEDDLATSYRVLQSPDGGGAFTTVLEGLSSVTAFATTADASVIWIGAGREGGLYESRDGGESFVRVHEELREVHCLHHRLERLWLCGNRQPNLDGIWVSKDVGGTFEPVLTFEQVTEPVPCADGAASLCDGPWRDWVLEIFDGNDPRHTPDAGVPDAGGEGVPDAGGPGGGGSDDAATGHADAAVAPAKQALGGDCSVPRAPARTTTGSSLLAYVMLGLALCTMRRRAARVSR